MTAQIVDTIDKVLNPLGIAVIIDAKHQMYDNSWC